MNTLAHLLLPMNAQRLRGLLLTVLGLAALVLEGARAFDSATPAVQDAVLGGAMAALATGLGAIPAIFMGKPSARIQDTMYGFGAGVMLAASAFSLIIPGLAAATAQGLGAWGANLVVGGGLLLGAGALLWMERVLPQASLPQVAAAQGGVDSLQLRRAWLFVFAIALHNLPEGLAIGTAFAGTERSHATALTIGIAIQDLPEGLVVALALLAAGYSRLLSVSLAILSGLIEPVGSLLGAGIVGVSASLLPWGLGFAAGAMIFVVSHEIIPESHRKGHQRFATAGLLLGFVLMMALDTALGGAPR